MEKEKLDPFIADLLHAHDCVIIADLGGFVANYKPAFLNPVQHTLSPPSKKIAFNASLRVNDGLLASHISESRGTSYQEACKLISRYVEESLQLLDSGKKLNIDKIGSLFYNKEKKLQFTPDHTVNYLPDSFGLSAVHSPLIRREAPLRRKMVPLPERIAEAKPDAGKKRVSPWRWVELIPAAAVFVFLFLNPVILQQCTRNMANLLPDLEWGFPVKPETAPGPVKREVTPPVNEQREQPEAPPADPVTPGASAPLETSMDSATAHAGTAPLAAGTETVKPVAEPVKSSPAPLPEEIKPDASAPVFYLVAGCFKMEENAEALYEELLSKGFASERPGKHHGLHLVTFQQSGSRAEARIALEKLKAAGLEAWVLKK